MSPFTAAADSFLNMPVKATVVAIPFLILNVPVVESRPRTIMPTLHVPPSRGAQIFVKEKVTGRGRCMQLLVGNHVPCGVTVIGHRWRWAVKLRPRYATPRGF